jgi:RNA polymerase sigma factor (TIGR02999 family)
MITSIHSLATPTQHGAPVAPVAADALFATLYDELHRVARRELARRSDSAGLGVTTLLHEAYLAISDREGALFPDRARFMAYAARVMRGLIIDDLRGRLAHKRGGGLPHTTLITDIAQDVHDLPTLERISDALDELATHDPSLAELVDLKFFCGFSFVEIAAMRRLGAHREAKLGKEPHLSAPRPRRRQPGRLTGTPSW